MRRCRDFDRAPAVLSFIRKSDRPVLRNGRNGNTSQVIKPMQIRDAVRVRLLAPLTLIMLIGITGVGWSQDNANTLMDKQDSAIRKAKEAEKQQRELDAAYKATLGKTKPAAPADPWSNVRPAK